MRLLRFPLAQGSHALIPLLRCPVVSDLTFPVLDPLLRPRQGANAVYGVTLFGKVFPLLAGGIWDLPSCKRRVLPINRTSQTCERLRPSRRTKCTAGGSF